MLAYEANILGARARVSRSISAGWGQAALLKVPGGLGPGLTRGSVNPGAVRVRTGKAVGIKRTGREDQGQAASSDAPGEQIPSHKCFQVCCVDN